MSKLPSSRLKVIRLSEARLHAVSSRNMYSEQGLDALIRPPAGQVCQALMVLSNWMPGSAEAQAASTIRSHSSGASIVFATLPSVRRIRSHSPPASTFRRKASVTRIELLEFWPETVR